MRIDSLGPWTGGPWTGALLAAGVALLACLLPRALARPNLAALAAPLGIGVGWIATLGLITASPRQLAERLPVLALAALLAALASAAVAARPFLVWVMAAIGAVATGWWMGGAPMGAADFIRALPVIGGVAGAVLLGHALLRDGAQMLAALLALTAALAVATTPGPQMMLAVIAACGVAAAWIGGGLTGAAARLPLAILLAALAAVPVLARGGSADWLAAGAPYAALLLGPALATRLPAQTIQIIAALLCAVPILLAIAWLTGRIG